MADRDTNWRARLRAPIISAALLFSAYLYGDHRINQLREQLPNLIPVKVALVQPNIPIKGVVENLGEAGTLESLMEQSGSILNTDPTPDLIVWPEIPLYFSPHNSPADRDRIENLLHNQRTPLLLNADMFSNETINGRVPFYNAEQLFRGGGHVVEEYRKMMLVPLGEYLPFEELLNGPKLERIFSGLRRYTRGIDLTVFHLAPGITIGTPVCLEALHSPHISKMVEAGATILVNPANDAYFGDTAGATLNFSFAILRAVEFRLPIVRVTNSGLSGVINQLGEVIPESKIPQFTIGSRSVNVSAARLDQNRPHARSWGIGILAGFASLALISRLIINFVFGHH